MDRFSPLRPACVRVLVLPIGQLERSVFTEIVASLQHTCSIVPLKELASSNNQSDSPLTPSEQSPGSLLFNFTPSSTPEQQQQYSSPFELWREPLLVLGIVSAGLPESRQHLVTDALEQLRERHARVIHRHLLVLRQSADIQHDFALQNVAYLVQDDTTSDLSERLLSAVRNISSQFLRELGTYSQAMQASPSIQTPGHPVQTHLRPMLTREDERPRSNHSTPVEPRSPSGDDNASRPTSREFLPPPATSFDQIAAANNINRSDSHGSGRSKSRARANSFDRVTVQALSKEKLKDRGKARVGVVIGSIYLLAGQWTEALKVLVDNTTRLRALSDHIWHGKGLENIFVCLLLHVWADIELQVPPICYQLSDKVRDRLSKAIAAELQQRVTAQQTPIEKLAASTPDLLKHVLLLYRAVESSLELPYTVVSEATVRLCKALAVLHNGNGVLHRQQVDGMLRPRQQDITSHSTQQISTSAQTARVSKTMIADILATALPGHDEVAKTQDHISVLTGVASVYSLLDLQRKKVITLRSLVNQLVSSMEQARKLGAAEMGIHPAASLSMESASDATSNAAVGSKALLDLAQDIVSVFGMQLSINSSDTERETTTPTPNVHHFGSQVLKLESLQDLLRLCESTSDLQGISKLVSACMLTLIPPGYTDVTTARQERAFAPDEQAKFIGMMAKAQNLSLQLGMPETLAEFWDPQLVRHVSFKALNPERALVKLSSPHSAPAIVQQSSSNPLLYDPNAPKPKDTQQAFIVAAGERIICEVTLQNNLDTAIEIERLTLITEGVQLATSVTNIVLGRARLQRITFEVEPEAIGATKITGCRIKVVGCLEQVFPITRAPETPSQAALIKNIGQDVIKAAAGSDPRRIDGNTDDVTVSVVARQPYLILQGDVRPASELMLLDGEIKRVSMTLYNASAESATLQSVQYSESMHYLSAADISSIPPGQTGSFDFDLTAQASLKTPSVTFVYSADPTSEYARTCTVQFQATVQPGLEVVRFDATPQQDDSIRFALDLSNKWHLPIAIELDGSKDEKQYIAAGRTQRYHIMIKRPPPGFRASMSLELLLADLREGHRLRWSTDDRAGRVSVPAAMITPEIESLLQGPPLAITLCPGDKQQRPTAKVGSFFVLRAVVENRSASESGALRVQLFCQTEGIPAHEARRGIAVIGSLQKLVPSVSAFEQYTAEFAICALSSGVLEIDAVARPVLPGAKDTAGGHTEHRLTVTVVD